MVKLKNKPFFAILNADERSRLIHGTERKNDTWSAWTRNPGSLWSLRRYRWRIVRL